MHDFLENPIILEDMERIYKSRDNWSELNDSTIYITGAAGMIASYICMFLIYLVDTQMYNMEIYAGIRDKDKAEKRYGYYIEKPYFHIYSKDVISPLFDAVSFDYIIHAASLASPQYYGIMPVETVLPNIIGTYELMKYAKANTIKSMLFFSSGGIYGSINNVDAIDESMYGDFDFLQTGNFYGESKRCGEMLCRAYHMEYQVPVKSVRIHHTYGPTLDPGNDSRVFAEFVGNIINNKNIIIKSEGTAKRAFCYLTDAVSGILRVLLDGENGESYNLGNSAEYISVAELAEKLVKMFPEKKLHVQYKKRESSSYVASNAVKADPVNVDKLCNLGWKPVITVEEGFYRTVKVFLCS